MISLIAEPDAAKTVGASGAIFAKRNIVAVFRIFAKESAETLPGNNKAIAQFRITEHRSVHRILVVQKHFGIQYVLAFVGKENKVAIFCRGRIINVIGIYERGIAHAQCHLRRRLIKLFHLREKRPRRIVCPCILRCVPLVAPPAIIAIHSKLAFRRIHRNDAFFAEIAGPLIERAVAHKHHAPLEPAVRAPRGRRHLHVFVERKILGFNRKWRFAILAISRLGGHRLILSILHDFRVIALLAIDDLGSFRRIGGFEFVDTVTVTMKMLCGVFIYSVLAFSPFALARTTPQL